MSDERLVTPKDWGTWESTGVHGYLAGLDATPDERIAWVEEMLRLAVASGACPRPRDGWGQPIAITTAR